MFTGIIKEVGAIARISGQEVTVLAKHVLDDVKQGDSIAEVGATGRVTGPHLDSRMNLGPTRVDPGLLLPGFPDAPDAAAGVD